jgi:hypothetical protein
LCKVGESLIGKDVVENKNGGIVTEEENSNILYFRRQREFNVL